MVHIERYENEIDLDDTFIMPAKRKGTTGKGINNCAKYIEMLYLNRQILFIVNWPNIYQLYEFIPSANLHCTKHK